MIKINADGSYYFCDPHNERLMDYKNANLNGVDPIDPAEFDAKLECDPSILKNLS